MQAVIDTNKAIDFLYGGKAIMTIQSNKTQKHFTYKIVKNKKAEKEMYFVSLLTGPSNTSDYTFLGTIFGQGTFRHGSKSKIGAESLGAISFNWFVKRLHENNITNQVNIFHEGFCCCCGRTLTTPESVAAGIGPECSKRRK